MFQANEWAAKGYKHSLNNEHDKAIEAYTSAIALYPNLAKAYNNLASAYNNRGFAYDNKGHYDKAIEDYNKEEYHQSEYVYANRFWTTIADL